MKKTIHLLFVLVIFGSTTVCSQVETKTDPGSDEINMVDDNGLKQGYWDTTERNIRSKGIYVDDQGVFKQTGDVQGW